MVKCPRGTASQVRANLAHINRQNLSSFNSSFSLWTYDPVKGQPVYVGEKDSETLAPESEESELESNRADKRPAPNSRDELVYFFISYFLDILLESWEGKPCLKSKLTSLHSSVENEAEDFGEDLGPCEISIVSSTADYLKDLYQKRSFNLSKERMRKDSVSVESEYLNEEDFECPEEAKKSMELEEDVHFVFINGVWYKGKVSRRLMEGDGTYFWEDGSTYQGEFEGGCVTGRGRLEFPDLSVYEGGVYKAFRHGEGMFCISDSTVMYSGQWWLGKKQGNGLIIYNDPYESHNFYRGQWQDGVKEGFGFRQYPSGAKYVGFWSNGKRHGRGVMFWSNHDIYRGDWKEGTMHGYGEYSWNGFINKFLSYPASNTYRGFWANGKRNGRGLFELKSGALIETVWVDNMKEGLGAVICENGTVIASENLFVKDKPALNCSNRNNSESLNKDVAKLTSNKKKKSTRYSKQFEFVKLSSIPIHSPVHTLNLGPHTEKLFDQKKEMIKKYFQESLLEDRERLTPEPKELDEILNFELTETQNSQMSKCRIHEEKYLRNCIISNMAALKACYDFYAELACKKPPSFKCVLLRLFLWQMFIDADVVSSELSLIDIDKLLECEKYLLTENPHDPFEQIHFWQFIHILIVLSWHFYGQFISREPPLVNEGRVASFLSYYQTLESKNVLKAAFQYFLEKDLFQGRFREGSKPLTENGNRFEEIDLAPMEAMYIIYRNVGEPHSARDFVTALCRLRGEDEDEGQPCIVRYFEKLPFFKIEGWNALTVAGELQHIPGQEPFNYPEIFKLDKDKIPKNPKSELTCFNNLKAKRVVKCLMEVCPGIAEEDFIVNMDYQLTFLEFYKALILCTKLQLKMKIMNELKESILDDYKIQLEEYKKQLSEFEKLNEVSVVSRKKSRQFAELAKKGRK